MRSVNAGIWFCAGLVWAGVVIGVCSFGVGVTYGRGTAASVGACVAPYEPTASDLVLHEWAHPINQRLPEDTAGQQTPVADVAQQSSGSSTR